MGKHDELLDRSVRCGCGICEACEYAERIEAGEKFWKANAERAVMVHDWPECGPGSINVEALYQAFKARLLSETSGGKR